MADDKATFEIDLPVVGQDKIEAAASAVDVLAARLDQVSKAVKAQNDSYRQAEQTADRAAKALERVGLAIDAQRSKLAEATESGNDKAAERAASKLRNLVERQAEATKAAHDATKALGSEAAALDKLKAAEAGASKALDAEKAKKLNGALQGVVDKVKDFGAKFSGTGGAIAGTVLMIAAAETALLAFTVATVASVVGVATLAVQMADARRESVLLAQGMTQSIKGGQDLTDSARQLAKTLPVSTEQLTQLGAGFAWAGLRGQALTDAIRRSAEWSARLKFGPDFKREMLSLSEQSKVLHLNIASLFGGLKIEGLLGGLQKMVSLLDDSTASGRAIKVVFESIFQPLIDKVAESKYKVEAFFLHLEIWALKALIALKPHASEILRFGEALLIVAGVLGGVLVVAAAAAAAALMAPFLLVAGLVYHAMKLAEVGRAMVDGIVQGITERATAVWEALKGVVSRAVDGVKAILQIHSPSQVFADIGYQTGAGMAIGVSDSSGAVQSAYSDMVQPPAASSAAPAPAASGGHSISGNTFVFHGVKDAEDAEQRFTALFTRLLEGDAAQLGGVAPG